MKRPTTLLAVLLLALSDALHAANPLGALEEAVRRLGAPGAIVLNKQVHLFYQTYGNGPRDAICHAVSDDGLRFMRDASNPIFHPAGNWNASETGHPGVFEDANGRTYLFVQGNNDKGCTWFLSCFEIGWRNGRPLVIRDSIKFPMEHSPVAP
jgi:hypothetical protein